MEFKSYVNFLNLSHLKWAYPIVECEDWLIGSLVKLNKKILIFNIHIINHSVHSRETTVAIFEPRRTCEIATFSDRKCHGRSVVLKFRHNNSQKNRQSGDGANRITQDLDKPSHRTRSNTFCATDIRAFFARMMSIL